MLNGDKERDPWLTNETRVGYKRYGFEDARNCFKSIFIGISRKTSTHCIIIILPPWSCSQFALLFDDRICQN